MWLTFFQFSKVPFMELLLFLILLPKWSMSHLNLYLEASEVKRLFGVGKSELFYVREGVLNLYALNFSVPVPASLYQLFFVWHRISRKPLYYRALLESDNIHSMSRPTLNITSTGVVPQDKTMFSLTLPCTGTSNAEVHVNLHMNVSSSQRNPKRNDFERNFTIRRTKICLRGERYKPANESKYQQSIPPHDTRRGNGTNPLDTLFVATGTTCTATVLIVTLVALVYLRRMRDKMRQKSVNCSYYSSPTYFSGHFQPFPLNTDGSDARHGVAPTFSSNNSYATIPSTKKFPHFLDLNHDVKPTDTGKDREAEPISDSFRISSSPYPNIYPALHSFNTSSFHSPLHTNSSPATSRYSKNSWSKKSSSKNKKWRDSRDFEPSERVKQLSIDRWRVVMGSLLQEGTFGRVYDGVCQDPVTKNAVSVIVKTISDGSSSDQSNHLLREGLLLHGLKHDNLLPILGVCLQDPRTPLIIFPNIDQSNLKLYLRGQANNKGLGNNTQKLLTRDAVYVAIGIGEGLLHLHKHKLLHKDIATRNCLITNDLQARLTDTALSRDLFPADYHCLGDNENRPLKWMSYEAITKKEFSDASDVWMFGVFLWELMTSAQQPYTEVDPFEMEDYLRDGYRLSQPHSCPDDLFTLMAVCWAPLPSERPSLKCLVDCLKDFHTALYTYV